MTFFSINNHSGHEPPRIGVFSLNDPVLPPACLLLTLQMTFPISWLDAHGTVVFIGSLEFSDSKAQEQLFYWKESRRTLSLLPTGLGSRMVSAVCPEAPRSRIVPSRNHTKGVCFWQRCPNHVSFRLRFGAKELLPPHGANVAWLWPVARCLPEGQVSDDI